MPGHITQIVTGCQDCFNGLHRKERANLIFAVSLTDQRIITKYGTCDFCGRDNIIVAIGQRTTGKRCGR